MKLDRRSGLLSVLAAAALLISSSSAIGAGKAPPPAPCGVGVTPAVYLINFLLVYSANPNEADPGRLHCVRSAGRSPAPVAHDQPASLVIFHPQI